MRPQRNHEIVRQGIVTAISDGFRCTVRTLDYGTIYKDVIVNPSPYGAVLPEKDALVLIYGVPNSNNKQVIACLRDVPPETADYDLEYIHAHGEENDGNFPDMKPGDVFVGKYGRAYFYKTGDIRIGSLFNRTEIYFSDNGLLDLNGLNFNLHTKDDGIEVKTTSDVEGTFGTSFHINRNISDKLISSFNIDESGEVSIGAGDGVTYHCMATFDVTGDVSISNDLSGVELNAAGNVNIFSGASDFSGSLSSISLEPAGDMYLACAKEMALSADQKVSVSSSIFSVEADLTIELSTQGTIRAEATAISLEAPTSVQGALSVAGPIACTGAMTMPSAACAGAMAVGSMVSPSITTANLVATGTATAASLTAATLTVTGITRLSGSARVEGELALPGVETGGAFQPLSYRALVPVTVNGTVYNIPCI